LKGQFLSFKEPRPAELRCCADCYKKGKAPWKGITVRFENADGQDHSFRKKSFYWGPVTVNRALIQRSSKKAVD